MRCMESRLILIFPNSEEKRIEEEKKKREETEEKEREEREAAVLAMQKEREQEQEKLRELERQLLEDKVKRVQKCFYFQC